MDTQGYLEWNRSDVLINTDNASTRAKKLLATIFFEIWMLYCYNQNLDIYEVWLSCEHAFASSIVSDAVFQKNAPKTGITPLPWPLPFSDHIDRFIDRLGWDVFAICAWSVSFRVACTQEIDSRFWDTLIQLGRENRVCIITFAVTRNLNWRDLLVPWAHNGPPELDRALDVDYTSISDKHYHEVARGLDGVARPVTAPDGRPQINISDYMFNSQKWGNFPKFLRQIHKVNRQFGSIGSAIHDGPCDLCLSNQPCDCKVLCLGGLIELVEYANKGVGTRALRNFHKGDILGEFLGEFCPWEYPEFDYSLPLMRKKHPGKNFAVINPVPYGNWTRFINHSCNASTKFKARTIGMRNRMTVEAVRDIEIFEEITVNYGRCYWKGATCHCGEWNCVSREMDEDDQSGEDADDEDEDTDEEDEDTDDEDEDTDDEDEDEEDTEDGSETEDGEVDVKEEAIE